ncbi:MAG: GNAT family N-acetyltransferase [Gammaproteobacteria bacterium]|nr:GNAT family N-acetyltransferase [Gammaproteobacteria bacterium]
MSPARLYSMKNSLGIFSLREVDPCRDATLIHSWVGSPAAKYWLMKDLSVEEVEKFYLEFNLAEGSQAYLGYHNETPCFIVELYNPCHDQVAEHYTPLSGDIGMHLFVAQGEVSVHGFTRTVFNITMGFIFSGDKYKRVVVEPDCNNNKIHAMNILFGFQHVDQIQLEEKEAYLGFCSRDQYMNSAGRRDVKAGLNVHRTLLKNPQSSVSNLAPLVWDKVNRLHIKKCLSEFCHERILQPVLIEKQKNTARYRVQSDFEKVIYEFNAVLLPMDHWLIELNSINKIESGENAVLSSTQFILEFSQTLNLGKDKLPTYLEEVSATLYSSAYKHNTLGESAQKLTVSDFQIVESAMIEGHPSFIANNGRIGFDATDFQQYAPEVGGAVRLIWLAAHKSQATFSCCADFSYEKLLADELDFITRKKFCTDLTDRGLSAEDYLLIPVHPWQWFNKIYQVYADDIATNKIVCLGYGDDSYQAQQSIRTFFNVSNPEKLYVKTALSILNMGFVRGLSAAYMKVTPAINDWLQGVIESDEFLKKNGFSILREIAAIGYHNPNYENEFVSDNPYRKMLAGLWRESPVNKINKNQRLMTMASLLHIDTKGEAVLVALIESSPLDTRQWLAVYLNAYLSPLLHCYFKYSLVYMPHGENVILVLENNVPVRIFMKDIGEEICLLNSNLKLPDAVSRILVNVPKEHEVLSFFTDIFDGFFRYLSAILFEHDSFPPEEFWKIVAACIRGYQDSHPEYSNKYLEHDLFSDYFPLSCLNRLQLKNNQQMVDLSDPSKLLQFEGDMKNPIALYR